MQEFKREDVLGTRITLATAEEVRDFCRAAFLAGGYSNNAEGETRPWDYSETRPWVDAETRPCADAETRPWADAKTVPWADAKTRPWADAETLKDRPSTVKIYTPNPEIVMKAEKDPDYRAVFNRAELVLPDGIGVVLASRLKHGEINTRITGIGMLNELLALAEELGESVFLLGSKPGVSDKAAEKMKETFPSLEIAGTHHGYFKPEEEEDLAHQIADARPGLLVVAMGAPKQEFFIDKYQDLIRPKIAIGVGGALDVWSGNVKRAPKFISKIGMEWLYRAVKQPSRIPRLFAIPKFLFKAFFPTKENF